MIDARRLVGWVPWIVRAAYDVRARSVLWPRKTLM